MSKRNDLSRGGILTTGISSLAATAMSAQTAHADYKAPGEVRVLVLVGDYWHSRIVQQHHWHHVLKSANWRVMFAQSSQFVTPEALSKTDLFIFARYAGPDSLGWSNDEIVEYRPTSAPFMTDEQEDAIVDNVMNRGMGLIAVHCSIWNPERTKYLDLLGVEKSIMHTKVQPAHIHELNQKHVITKGLKDFNTGDDEIFNAELKPGQSTLLFKTSGEEQKIDANGGWCRNAGKGRIVALLPGHNSGPYMQEAYKKIMWRSAHWAMKKKPGSEDNLGRGFF